MITWTESPMITWNLFILHVLGFNPPKQGRKFQSQQGSLGLQDIKPCIRIVVYGERQPDWEETCILLMRKFYGLIRIPFVQPFSEPLPTTNNNRQKSSGFATYIPFEDHFDTRGILLDQHHIRVCSQLLLAHDSCFKNNVHKRAIHRKNLFIKKFIQPKSINQHQLTKINQPTFTNQDQPTIIINQRWPTTINQPLFSSLTPITTYFLNPTTPYLEWHHVGDQPKGDWRRSPPCLTGSSEHPEANSKRTWKWMLGILYTFLLGRLRPILRGELPDWKSSFLLGPGQFSGAMVG